MFEVSSPTEQTKAEVIMVVVAAVGGVLLVLILVVALCNLGLPGLVNKFWQLIVAIIVLVCIGLVTGFYIDERSSKARRAMWFGADLTMDVFKSSLHNWHQKFAENTLSEEEKLLYTLGTDLKLHRLLINNVDIDTLSSKLYIEPLAIEMMELGLLSAEETRVLVSKLVPEYKSEEELEKNEYSLKTYTMRLADILNTRTAIE